MARFTDIDLTGLPPPAVVEAIAFEVILTRWLDDTIARMSELGVVYDVGNLESDPAKKVVETGAFRDTVVRSRINDGALAVLLASSLGADLDHLAAYYGVERLVVTPATDDTAAVMETDEAMRERVQMAPEALACAGPPGAYQFHARTVDGIIKDVAALNPMPGHVHVIPLVSTGNGAPSPILIEKVRARLLEPDIKPLTDILTVRAPAITEYEVTAVLTIADGPDPEVVRKAAEDRLKAYVAARHKVGVQVRYKALLAAAQVAGVEDLDVTPSADVAPGEDGAAFATAVTVTLAGS